MHTDNSPRPYLVIKALYRPAAHVRTNKAGWADKQSNWDTHEQVTVVDRLNRSTLMDASVIIDIGNRILVKNRFDMNEPEAVMNHYLSKYVAEVEQGKNFFALKQYNAALNAKPSVRIEKAADPVETV